MPMLENPKHEAFALNIAKGMKQRDAYVHAGYSKNDSAASRLAASPVVKNRIEELRVEIYQRINAVANTPNEETVGSLQEMGLTLEWCARQFKEIYTSALADGQYAPANAAVSNIQKLIEVKSAGKPEDEKEKEPLIKISEVRGMLDSLKGVIEATKEGPNKIEDPADVAVDITPDVSRVGVLEDLKDVTDDNA